ncbi:GroES-like protein [Penicillium cf. griseofulvum]|uniref:GroES-like protein n=1 Tax=Penicillium cf. griseofulvum TaxID=2972120 RepID=A0A9W9M1V6_9EURO|nr:GroES-like protein [Penicillium cf. griseofulvum]KAJ5429573.1 GroES-like protein [Penicillium cf. griseofulvum]
MIPSKQQTALKITPEGLIAAVACSLPSLQNDELLVRVRSIALNPFDAKSAELSPTTGATLGCDFAGDIVATGSDTNKRNFSIGDRVCGCVFGNNPNRLDNGAFAEYVAVPEDLLFRVPEHMDYNGAATLGVGLATVGMSLYNCLELPMEANRAGKPPFVLVYGGSTATGTLAIQILARSGYTPITTCSPHNFNLVKSLGAIAAFDYHSPTCGRQIRDYSSGTICYALDCITDTRSMAVCYESIGPSGGRYLSLEPFPIRGHTRRSIKPNWVLSLTMYNQPIPWKRPFKRDACPQDWEFAKRWFQIAQKIIDAGEIRPHMSEVRAGGWNAVSEGLALLQRGERSGRKLVYEVVRH